MSPRPRTGMLGTHMEAHENDATAIASAGYVEPVWALRALVWASVEPQPGAEMVLDAAEQWRQPMLVALRWDSRIKRMITEPTRWRLRVVTDTSIVYDVLTAVNPGLANKWLELTCVAGSVVPTA